MLDIHWKPSFIRRHKIQHTNLTPTVPPVPTPDQGLEAESYKSHLSQLTSMPPAKRENLVELECRQIWCSPGVWDVKVNLPSEPYCRARMTWREGTSVSIMVGVGWTVLKALRASRVDKQSFKHPSTLKGVRLLSSSCQKCVCELFGTGVKSLTLGWYVTAPGKGFPLFIAHVLSIILVYFSF